ncbi:MAG TPA: hypothetical protein VFY58_11020 [Nocardioides sp.]|nr:hypothetical protein [Nocardioides sp.]
MRRLATVLTLLICSVAALSGCGNDEPDTSAEPEETSSPAEPEETSSPAEPEETSSPDDDDTATIEITVSNGSVSPNGERVEIDAGQPIELIVKADEAGEIHVHSTPEQEYEYGNGTTTLKLTPIERPGVVEVETHHPQLVVVQLEVS